MGEALLAPFTMTEMQEAVRDIDGQKYRSEDGLSRAFFTIFWEQIHQPLLAAFQHIFSSGQMPESLAAGLICLFLSKSYSSASALSVHLPKPKCHKLGQTVS